MPRTLVVGDIHGQYFSFLEVLKKSHFDYENDILILLGDIIDRGEHVFECVEEILKIKHKVFVMGNHDYKFLRYFHDTLNSEKKEKWLINGGKATLESYKGGIPAAHKAFFESAVLFYELDNNLFVHAGIDETKSLDNQEKRILLGDRTMVERAKKQPIGNYQHIFIGHTPVQKVIGPSETKPQFLHNVVALDTRPFGEGVLTIMDVNTLEYWQSNPETQ